MDGIAPSHQTQNLAEVIPPVLHINVLGTLHAAVLVEIHDLAVPSARLQLFAESDQTHAPATHGWRPVPNLQNAFCRGLFRFHAGLRAFLSSCLPVLAANVDR